MIVLEFFKGKGPEPSDAYPIHEDSRAIGVIAHNWLQMHSGGRVVITAATTATTVPAPAPRSVDDLVVLAQELAAPARE